MFKTFPEFSKLTLADREEYEGFIKQHPPVGDISFVSMMTWWDGIGSADVSVLNGNLVISYWVPGNENASGLSLVGTNRLEESICEIFDYLQDSGDKPRLVNVPEFVVNGLRYPELFRFISQRSEDEYIIPLSRMGVLEQIPMFRRASIKNFMRLQKFEDVHIKSLNLSDPTNRQYLLESASQWPKQGFNDLGSVEDRVLHYSIGQADKLGLQNACLFIGQDIQAYCLYHQPHNPEYAITDHARINYDIPHIFDYLSFAFSQHFMKQGVRFVNIHGDLGFARLRVFKLALRPSNFFRKYIIEPAK